MRRVSERNSWYLVSSHGSVLFYVAANRWCTVEGIVGGMHLTRQTVWGIIGDLRRAGMLLVRREGRVHHYSVALDGPVLHRTISGVPLRVILGRIVEESERVAAGAR